MKEKRSYGEACIYERYNTGITNEENLWRNVFTREIK